MKFNKIVVLNWYDALKTGDHIPYFIQPLNHIYIIAAIQFLSSDINRASLSLENPDHPPPDAHHRYRLFSTTTDTTALPNSSHLISLFSLSLLVRLLVSFMDLVIVCSCF